MKFFIFLALFAACFADKNCLEKQNGYDSSGFIAHFTHSIRHDVLQRFKPNISTNTIMTVDLNLTSSTPILDFAPMVQFEKFDSFPLKLIGLVMQNAFNKMYDIKNYGPLERIVHIFHMEEHWNNILKEYQKLETVPKEKCECYKKSKPLIQEKLKVIALQLRDPEKAYKVNNKKGYYIGYQIRYQFGEDPSTKKMESTLPAISNFEDWIKWKNALIHTNHQTHYRVGAEYLYCLL